MLTFGVFRSALNRLRLENRPAIVHASLKSFGAIYGGAETVIQALLSVTGGLIMPTFTYKTMVTPAVGPPNNGLTYGTNSDSNFMAESFHPDMPADSLMGVLPETLRHNPHATRTAHPILSFCGVSTGSTLNAQTLYNPLAPIGMLGERDGWVLLMGVDHTVSTSIHYAERLAERQQFVRWALMQDRVVECRGFPGCSDGFNEIVPDIRDAVRRIEVGASFIEAVPMKRLFAAVVNKINNDPLALLCQRIDCERCNSIRLSVAKG